MGFNRLYIPTLDSLKKTMKIAGKKKYLKMAAKQDAFFETLKQCYGFWTN